MLAANELWNNSGTNNKNINDPVLQHQEKK